MFASEEGEVVVIVETHPWLANASQEGGCGAVAGWRRKTHPRLAFASEESRVVVVVLSKPTLSSRL